MKKKLVALLMIGTLVLAGLTGCNSSGDTDAGDQMSDTDIAGEGATDYLYGVQVYGLDEAIITLTYVDETGESYVEETGATSWFGTSGATIGQLMEEWGVVSIEASCEGYELLGWTAYENVVETNEDGFEDYVTYKLFDGKVFTTEEMMTIGLPDGDVTFYTVWDLVCGGCEQSKVCEVYYIDDGRYFVCDDCYEEFATGMGLQ